MGGYSEKCRYCERWFTAPGAINDHIRGKHPDKPRVKSGDPINYGEFDEKPTEVKHSCNDPGCERCFG